VDVDDRDIVEGLRRGDAAAFNRAYATYRPRVYGFLLRLSGRRDVADDLLQETWLRLARSASELREDTVLLSWLFTVARNQFLSFRRWSVLDVTRLLSFGAETLDVIPGPEARSEATARLSVLERALLELPTEARETLLLVAVEGVEQDEAARILGISYAALRQRLSRARAELDRRVSLHDTRAGDKLAEQRSRGTT
jgi:RNA polymerase sigma factor (sigma-70 family)